MANTGLIKFNELEKSVRWFRGISEQQTNALNDLLHALRDDIEQETTYRVRKCLIELGLKPILTSKQIKLIMSLSAGNDLAFLWFIWEAYYKKPQKSADESYTLNEQFILSGIVHLDMPSTMRALDHMLPSAEHSKKHQDTLRARAAKLSLKNAKRKTQTRPKIPKSDIPYLVPQPRPKIFIPKAEFSQIKDRKVNFPSYDYYKDTMYQIPNESSRWFATYEMSPAKREMKKCLSKALDLVFADNRGQPGKSLCNIHQMLESSATRRQEELTNETLQRCMKLLDIRGSEQLKRRKYILEQLESAVALAAQKLRLFKQQKIMLLKQNYTSNCSQDCQMYVNTPKATSFNSYGDGPHQKGDFTILFNSELEIAAHPLIDDSDENQPVAVLEMGNARVMKSVYVNKEKCQHGYPRYLKGKGAYCASMYASKDKNCIHQNPIMDEKITILNDKDKVLNTISPSKVSLCTPKCVPSDELVQYCSRKNMVGGMPQWDYFKVFEPPAQSQSDDPSHDRELEIRRYCIQALKKTMELPHKPNPGADVHKMKKKQYAGNYFQSTADAAEQCALRMVKEGVKSAQITLNNETQDHICSGFKRLEQFTNIDPEDTHTLLKLLKRAFDTLKRNPHYVLVTLPNAHKLPILLDWIAERYGKTYNTRQMDELEKSTCHVFDNLNKHFMNIHNLPQPCEKHFIGSHKNLQTYDSYKELQCRIQKMRNNFNKKLIKDALYKVRLTWFALRCYSDLTGLQAKTFFAYLPASEQDFLQHSLWKSTEYRNMVFARQQFDS